MSTPLSRQMDQMADAQEWRERAERAEAALRWYAERATALNRYKDKPHATMAVITELSLDNGKRADAALAATGWDGPTRSTLRCARE